MTRPSVTLGSGCVERPNETEIGSIFEKTTVPAKEMKDDRLKF